MAPPEEVQTHTIGEHREVVASLLLVAVRPRERLEQVLLHGEPGGGLALNRCRWWERVDEAEGGYGRQRELRAGDELEEVHREDLVDRD